MSERRVEGSLPGRVSFLIAAACVVTVLVAATGMKSIWDVTYYASSRDAFWYCNGIALGLTVALALAFLPRWHLPRLLRVAVLVPLMHLGALIVAVKLWAILRADTWAYLVSVKDDNSPVPTPPDFLLATALVVVAGMLIARRRGEWAHASMMLALSTLLLVGLWLPIVCSWWSTDDGLNLYANIGRGHRVYFRMMYSSYEHLRLAAILPPVIAAIAFTAVVFRRRAFFARHRARVSLWVKILFVVAMLAQISGSDRTGLLYLEHTYIILFVVGLVIATFVVFGATTWLDSWRAHRALAGKARVDGTIAIDGDQEAIATLEITSWLRGPRLATRAFAVRTPSGDVPVTTGNVILPMPPSTLALGVGETAGVWRPATPSRSPPTARRPAPIRSARWMPRRSPASSRAVPPAIASVMSRSSCGGPPSRTSRSSSRSPCRASRCWCSDYGAPLLPAMIRRPVASSTIAVSGHRPSAIANAFRRCSPSALSDGGAGGGAND